MAPRLGPAASPAACPVGAGVFVVLLCVAALSSVAAVPAEPSASNPSAAPPSPAASSVPLHPAAKEAAAMPSNQDVAAFFPSINGDLSKVTWAHAVNSQAELKTALETESIMMLEADVIMGTLNGSVEVQPIMGHPPSDTGDLSLNQFINRITEYNSQPAHKSSRRGIKLDFKSLSVYNKSIDYLKTNFPMSKLTFPVWLNADILHGPINATAVPVDAQQFLDKAKQEYPQLTLSLGWTTRWGSAVPNQTADMDKAKYSDDDVDSMISKLSDSKVTQPITYALRAAFVANSLTEIKRLLNATQDITGNAPTVTVWSSDEKDEVDVKKLRSNILELGQKHVYVDVGSKLAKDLNLPSAAVGAFASVATTLMAAVAVVLANL